MPIKNLKKNKELIIKYGMEGREIENCQKLLQKTGSKIQVTGKFNIGMVSAVMAFQRKNGLKVTGKIGVETLAKLKERAREK